MLLVPHLLWLLSLPTALTPIGLALEVEGATLVLQLQCIVSQKHLPLSRWNAYMAFQLVQGMDAGELAPGATTSSQLNN
jgi:hypothetical protein